MSPIEILIKKTLENYKLIESGERSIAKGKVLNESANIVIRLALLQMQQCPSKNIEELKNPS
jgi:hypothetical protein